MKNPLLCAIISIVSIGLCHSPLHADSDQQPMNILWIMADDLNTWPLDYESPYAGGKLIAPNMKRLAENSVNFVHAYTAAPTCSPSRTAFLSGVAPWVSGHYHNITGANESQPLRDSVAIGTTFSQAGYYTNSFGKVKHGYASGLASNGPPLNRRDGGGVTNPPLMPIGKGEQDWGPIEMPEEQMHDTRVADLLIEELQKDHDKPFFIAGGMFNPHMPWYVPQKYFDMYPLDTLNLPELPKDDLDDLPPLALAMTQGKAKFVKSVVDGGHLPSAVQAHLATITYIDTHIGRVLDALEKSAYRDNTIVIFFSDHGFHLGEKNRWQKGTLWEQATHIPFMIHVPNNANNGVNSERFISTLDIYPTLVDLCGLEMPPHLDGRSLRPLLEDPEAEWPSTAITGSTNKGIPELAHLSIRNENGRYIRYSATEEEFYDHNKDPNEWTNEINNPEYAAVIETMRGLLPSIEEAALPMPQQLKNKGIFDKLQKEKAEARAAQKAKAEARKAAEKADI